MTLLSRLLSVFPAIILAGALASVAAFVASPGPLTALGPALWLYGVPLLAFHLHQRAHPLTEGVSTLRGDAYSPWWGSHQIQWIYLAFPSLESALRAVPGLYSAWLRAWGARIGVGVYWTPTITVADRSLLQIDDHVVIGERFAASSHIIKPTHDGTDLLLVVRSVRVGAGAFVGAGVVMGPGASVPAGAFVPSGTAILPGTRFSG